MAEPAAPAPHRVRRLRWQARAPSPAEAFALRSLLQGGSEAVHTALAQACAAALREAGGAGSGEAGAGEPVWHVPRLLLRIDAADLAQLDAELPGRVALALRDALADAGIGRTAARPADAVGAATTAATSARANTPKAQGRAVLWQYLATGGLHWSLAGLAADAAQAALQRAATEALQALWAGDLPVDALLPGPAEAVAERIGALGRWLKALPPALRQRWLAGSPAPAGVPAPLCEAWRALIAGSSSPEAAAAPPGPSVLDWQALWLAWGALPTPAGPVPTAARLSAAPALRHWLLRTAAATAPGHAAARLRQGLLQALGQTLSPPPATTADPPPQHPPWPALPTAPDEAAALLVPLAGLVLLHPFLPRLLAACGVRDATGRAIEPAQLPRACALLHALACGDSGPDGAAEHQLPFIKLLLGQPPEAPLGHTPPTLSAAEQDEVAALLDAVREHWAALRGTGVEGLRVSFLQRRGLLRRADGAWQLRMQGEAFDLLLIQLPWAIHLVKLPWMPQPVMVDWPSAS